MKTKVTGLVILLAVIAVAVVAILAYRYNLGRL